MQRYDKKQRYRAASTINRSNTQRKDEKFIGKRPRSIPLLCIGEKISLINRKQNSQLPAISFIQTGGYSIKLPMSKLYQLDYWGPYLEGYPCDDRPHRINKEKITLIWFDPNMSQDQDSLLERLRAINDFSLIYTDLNACVYCLKSINTEKIICITTSLGSMQLAPFLNNINQTQLFNNMIHQLPHDQKAKQQMIDACRDYYHGNRSVLNKIDEFESTYNANNCIQWYTKETFVYKLINKALRTEDIEQLYTFRYFITDLSKILIQEFEQFRNTIHSLVLYRGATMSCDEFNILKTNIGFLIATNSYFSTSKSREIAKIYVGTTNSTSIGVLFEIECDLKKNIIIADVARFSEIPEEVECLFNLGTTFEIISIEEQHQPSLIHIVKMKATDEQQTMVNDFIRQSREDIEDESLPIIFGILLNKMGIYDQCIRYFKNLLQDSVECSISRIHFHLADAYDNNDEYDMALEHLKIAYNIVKYRRNKASFKEQTYIWLHRSIVLNHMKRFNESLECSKKALKGFEQIYGRINHRDIASCLFSIGQSHFGLSSFGCDKSMRAQSLLGESFEYQMRVLNMQQACLPPDHVDIAITLGELSNLFYFLNDNQASLEFNKKSLSIQQKNLPSDHLALTTSLRNIATSYYEENDLDSALDYFQQCLVIQRKRLPPMHMEIARTERNIAKVLADKGEVEQGLQHLREGLPFSQDIFNEENIQHLYDIYSKKK